MLFEKITKSYKLGLTIKGYYHCSVRVKKRVAALNSNHKLLSESVPVHVSSPCGLSVVHDRSSSTFDNQPMQFVCVVVARGKNSSIDT